MRCVIVVRKQTIRVHYLGKTDKFMIILSTFWHCSKIKRHLCLSRHLFPRLGRSVKCRPFSCEWLTATKHSKWSSEVLYGECEALIHSAGYNVGDKKYMMLVEKGGAIWKRTFLVIMIHCTLLVDWMNELFKGWYWIGWEISPHTAALLACPKMRQSAPISALIKPIGLLHMETTYQWHLSLQLYSSLLPWH